MKTHYTELGPQMRKLVSGLIANDFTRDQAIERFDQVFLEEVLRAEHGNVCRAAKRLGVHRNTYNRLLPQKIITTVRNDCRWYAKRQPELKGLRYPVEKRVA